MHGGDGKGVATLGGAAERQVGAVGDVQENG